MVAAGIGGCPQRDHLLYPTSHISRNLRHFKRIFKEQMSRFTTKPTLWQVRPGKTQISLGIRPVWSESSLCALMVAKGLVFLHADSEDSDQTGRMSRLIWVFAGRTCHFVCFIIRRLKSWLETRICYDNRILRVCDFDAILIESKKVPQGKIVNLDY